MAQITLRDLFWVIVVVGVLACWLVDRQTAANQAKLMSQRQAQLTMDIQQLHERLRATDMERATLQRLLAKGQNAGIAK